MARIEGVLDGLTDDADQSERVRHASLSIQAHRPEMAAALDGFRVAMKTQRTLPPRLAELVRLRIAFHNQCRSCMSIRYQDALDDGLNEDLVCSLEKPYEAPDLTDAERVALRYADAFATNHLAIDDAMHAELREYFDEGEVVELGLWCALCVGFGRLSATWHMVDDLPEDYAADGTITPWGNDDVVVMR